MVFDLAEFSLPPFFSEVPLVRCIVYFPGSPPFSVGFFSWNGNFFLKVRSPPPRHPFPHAKSPEPRSFFGARRPSGDLADCFFSKTILSEPHPPKKNELRFFLWSSFSWEGLVPCPPFVITLWARSLQSFRAPPL